MRSVLMFVGSITAAGCAHVTPHAADPLPVQRVVLYQNGIAYFERSGTVHGDTLRLAVRPEQINDLLTSLTVIDRAGGQSQSISLPIDKTAAQRLDELPPQVRQSGGLLSLLQAFRGARLAVTTRDRLGELSGRVVGIEEGASENHLALASDGVIANIKLSAITRVKVLDRPLQVGLQKVLDHSLNQGQWKPVELAVRFDHAGRHDLLVSYVAEMPTWKPAYRLVLGDAQEGALLQGWAVVDNTSGEDWNQVELSLSSGSPISFRYDLHKPHFVQRPSIGVQHGQANAPVAAAAVGSADKVKERMMLGGAPSPRASSMGLSGEALIGGMGRAKAAKSARRALRRGASGSASGAYKARGKVSIADYAGAVGSGAKGEAMRGLFRYDVPGRVTVPDRSSTLVSLVNRTIDGEDLLIYRPDAGGAARHYPYRAVRFKNDTGYMLQGGPVSVLSKGMFVGSGVFDRIEADAETFLPFSLERGISVKREQRSDVRGTRLLAIVDGRVRCETRQRRTQVYEVRRLTKDAPSKLYVRVLRRSGWSLVDPPKGTRTHDDAWYVPATIQADTNSIEITDEQTTPQNYNWDHPLAAESLKLFLAGDAAPELKAAIEKVRAVNQELDALKRQAKSLSDRSSRMQKEQQRLRRNIATLGEAKINRPLAKKFAKRLGDNEAAIAKLSAQLVEVQEAMVAKRQALKVLIRAVRLEPSK